MTDLWRDPAGIGLLRLLRALYLGLGFTLLALSGVLALGNQDPSGWLYLAAAIAGFVLLPHSLLPSGIYAGAALYGLWGQEVDWVQEILLLGGSVIAIAIPRGRIADLVRVIEPSVAAEGTGEIVQPVPADDPPSMSPQGFEEGPINPLAAVDVPGAARTDPAAGRLSIAVLGRLSLLAGGRELAGELLERPTLSFLWLLLLVRALAGEPPLTRAALAAELDPRLPGPQRLGRLRGRLRDLARDLPRPLVLPVVKDGDLVYLDLSGARTDLEELGRWEARCRVELSAPEIPQLEELLAVPWPQVLPVWEECQDRQAAVRGFGKTIVGRLRDRADEQRVNCAEFLAAHLLAVGKSSQAVALLEHALERRPSRGDLAALLERARLEAGQPAAAAGTGLRHQQKEDLP